MSESLQQRLRKLENQVSYIRKQLQTQRRLTLKDKFRIHDRSQRLLAEFEAMDTYVLDYDKVKTVIKCLVELVDNALGTQP